jgi:hypothetical protein
MEKRAWIASTLWLGLCVVIVAWTAAVLVFRGLPTYDDTGYVLAIIQNYNHGKRLFVDLFSQYGPFYTQYYYFLGTLIPGGINHDVLGWVTVAHWTAGALLAGLAGLRLSGQLAVAVMCTLASAISMRGLRAEPGHPVSLCLLLAMALLPLVPGPYSRLAHLRLFGTGAVVGALCLTKINLGVFTGMAVVIPLLAFGPDRWLRLLGVMLSWLAVCLPALFVGPPWGRNARLVLILPVTTGALALAAVATFAWRPSEGRYRRSHVTSMVLGCISMLGISLAIELVRGSSATSLWDGIIRRPLALPGVFFLPPEVPMFIVAYAGAFIVGILLWLLLARAGSVLSPGLYVSGVCIIGMMWILIIYFNTQRFGYALGIMSAVVVPLVSVTIMTMTRRVADRTVYFAISGVVLWPLLSLYPVCGAQIAVPSGLGTAVLPALVAIYISSGWCLATWRWQVLSRTIGWAGACVAMVIALGIAVVNTKRYQGHVPLQFAGTARFRIPPVMAAEIKAVVANVQRHGGAFVTQPGFGSFYPWTGVDYPSGYMATIYSKLLRPYELAATLSRFPPQRPFLAIYSKSIMDFWLGGHDDGDDPVSTWLMAHTNPVYSGPVYQLRASSATPTFEPVHVAEVVAAGEHALASVTLPTQVVAKARVMEVFSKVNGRFLRDRVEWLTVRRAGDGTWSRAQLRLPWQVLEAIRANDKIALWFSSHEEPWLAGVIVARVEHSHVVPMPDSDR